MVEITIEKKKDGEMVLWSKDSGLPLTNAQVKQVAREINPNSNLPGLLESHARLQLTSQGVLTMLREEYGWDGEKYCACDLDGQGNHAPHCPIKAFRVALAKAKEIPNYRPYMENA